MTGGVPVLQSLSSRLEAAGFAQKSKAANTVASCPAGGSKAASISAPPGPKPKPDKASYEFCDLKQMTIKLAAPGKAASIVIDRVRKSEPVDPSAPAEYQSSLRVHDLVIEALGDIIDTTTTVQGKGVRDAAASAWSDTRARVGGASQGAVSKDNRPLGVDVTAVNSCSHSSFEPPHPLTHLEKMAYDSVTTHGGSPAHADYFSIHPGSAANTPFELMWPFGADRIKSYTIAAASCGNLPIPQKTTGSLSAELYVIPYEEWSITFGLGPRQSASAGKQLNFKSEQDGTSGRRIKSTTTVMKQVGNEQTTTTSEVMKTQSGLNRTRETTETKTGVSAGSTGKDVAYTVLGGYSETVKEVEQNWNKKHPTKTKDDPEAEYRKVTIKHKVAGQEVEADLNETIKQLFEFKKLLDKTKSLFDSIKFGASFSIGYELFSGNLGFAWGNEWPDAYAEDGRVYYVQRYVQITGSCEVFNATITGFCGLAFKPPIPLAKIEVEVGGYLSAGLKLSLKADVNHSWTKAKSNWKGTIEAGPSFTLEPGFKCTGRAFGYGIEGKVAIESEITYTASGEISTRHPPFVKSTFILGKESADSTEADPDADAVRLVAEIKTVGTTVHSWKLKPYGMMKGKVVWKDEYVIGKKPAD